MGGDQHATVARRPGVSVSVEADHAYPVESVVLGHARCPGQGHRVIAAQDDGHFVGLEWLRHPQADGGVAQLQGRQMALPKSTIFSSRVG